MSKSELKRLATQAGLREPPSQAVSASAWGKLRSALARHELSPRAADELVGTARTGRERRELALQIMDRLGHTIRRRHDVV